MCGSVYGVQRWFHHHVESAPHRPPILISKTESTIPAKSLSLLLLWWLPFLSSPPNSFIVASSSFFRRHFLHQQLETEIPMSFPIIFLFELSIITTSVNQIWVCDAFPLTSLTRCSDDCLGIAVSSTRLDVLFGHEFHQRSITTSVFHVIFMYYH